MLELLAAFCGASLPMVAGYGLGRRLTIGIPLPETIRFACGAAVLSTLLIAVLLLRLGNVWMFAALGLGGAGLLAIDRPVLRLHRPPLWIAVIATVYGGLYLLYVLTPEIQSDALNYHLSLSVEAARTGGFPKRILFYEVLPQGIETLFAMAYSVGGEVSAKLVHVIFLVLTIPLLLAVAELLNLAAWTAWCAGVLYAISPVVGVSATTAYNDAAMTFYVLATFYLLVLWWRKQNDALLFPLGLCAGFCYAIKLSGGVLGPVVLAAVLWKKVRPGRVLAGIAVAALPWMVRAAVLTGNPFAPLLNRFFPNPYFHVDTEQALATYLRDYGGVEWQSLALEVTVYGDQVQGLLGPLWLLLPLAVLALWRREGRLVMAAAAIAASPWLLNIGTRFLMPALPFLALALLIVVPRQLVPLLVAAHAILCWPQVIPLWAQPGAWALDREIPIASAIGRESVRSFRDRKSYERVLADLVDSNTKAGDRVFDLANAPAAVVSRDLVNAWQSALGDRLVRGLHAAIPSRRDSLVEWRSEFSARTLSAIRVRSAAAQARSAGIREIMLIDKDGGKLAPNVLWSFDAWPNVWDAALALDRNLVSAWMTRESVRPGMFLGFEMPAPASVAQVRIIADSPVGLELYGWNGEWARLPLPNRPLTWPDLNLRTAAIRLLRRERITHVLAVAGKDSFGAIGRDMIDSPSAWGLTKIAAYDPAVLLRVDQ